MVDYSKELTLEEEETIEETTTPYMIDETLANLDYIYDIEGVYIPFKATETPKTQDEAENLMNKWHDVDVRHVHLHISRTPSKDYELQYHWVSKRKKKNKPYIGIGKAIKRTVTITDEDTNNTGATSLIGKLAKAGKGFKLDIVDYQNFIQDVVSNITASDKLVVFKDENYILPSNDSTGYDIASEINERIHPTLTDEQKQEALEVEAEIKEKGFVKYMNDILDKIHIGDNRSIIRKTLGAYAIISGIYSMMLGTDGNSDAGKSYEDEIVLSAIPKRYIYPVNDMTKASFSRCAEIHERYFDRMICYMGDLGSEKSFKEVEDVFNILKILTTENEYSREVADKIGGKYIVKKFKLSVDTIGVMFQTIKFDFLDVEGDQLSSRSLKSTPAKADKTNVLTHKGIKIGIGKSVTNQKKAEAEKELKKFQSYLLYIISKDIEIVNPWITVFMRFVELSKTPFRDFDRVMYLFKAYCTLTWFNCEKIGDNEYLVTSEQLEEFMNNVNLDNVLPPSESDFLKMLIGKGTNNSLKMIDGENNEVNDLNIYFNEILEDLGYGENEETPQKVGDDKTQSKLIEAVVYESEPPIFDVLREWEIKEGIALLLEKYRLGGRSNKHKSNVFFTVTDVKRTYQKRKIYENIDDVPKLLNKLYNNGFLEKLDYKNVKGQNIYYLTSKCEKLMNTIEITEEDKKEAEKLMREEWLGKW